MSTTPTPTPVPMTARREIVVIGCSQGGVTALRRLFEGLPKDFSASILIVQHLSPDHTSQLTQILDRAGPLPVCTPQDGQKIEPGNAYLAPVDHHMLVERRQIRLTRGAKENLARPAIDPLFRSAAAAYGSQVVGVLLTGRLYDGAAGLAEIARSGGVAVIQSPQDAEAEDMPMAGLKLTPLARMVDIDQLPALLVELVNEPIEKHDAPVEVKLEAELTLSDHVYPDDVDSIGERAGVGCPECGGSLWMVNGADVEHLRCHVGHTMSVAALLLAQDQSVERALWTALRTLDERTHLLRKMAGIERDAHRDLSAVTFDQKARESESAAEPLRRLLLTVKV